MTNGRSRSGYSGRQKQSSIVRGPLLAFGVWRLAFGTLAPLAHSHLPPCQEYGAKNGGYCQQKEYYTTVFATQKTYSLLKKSFAKMETTSSVRLTDVVISVPRIHCCSVWDAVWGMSGCAMYAKFKVSLRRSWCSYFYGRWPSRLERGG